MTRKEGFRRAAIGAAAVLLVGLIPGVVGARPSRPQSDAAASPVRRVPRETRIDLDLAWMIAGDSYSSGEGTHNTLKAPAQGQGRCARADGRDGRGLTWGLVAQQRVNPAGQAALVACSGTTSGIWPKQVEEARNLGVSRPDVVTVSFGGNNLGFADVVIDCVDAADLWGFYTSEGCSTSEQDLRGRVDYLVGKRSSPPPGMKDSGTLPALYDAIAKEVNPGGLVVVAGYPNLTEDPGRWGWIYCDGLSREDAGMLRSVAGYLNQQIALQVAAANDRNRGRGVTIEWVDTSQVYESPSGRHGLCAHDDEWVNGVTPDAIRTSSFHPKQAGYSALGEEVAKRVDAHVFPRERLLEDCLDEASATYLLQTEGRPDSYRSMAVEGVDCREGWVLGTLVEGSDGFGTVLMRRLKGRWGFVYGAGSMRAVCDVAQARNAPKWISDVLDCPDVPLLTSNAIGPVRVGMSLDEAKATGWLGTSLTTCADELGGGASPGEFLFELDGPNAPDALQASVEVFDYKITLINVSEGARMAGGVVIGSWDSDTAVSNLEDAGYQVTREPLFDLDDFGKATAPDGSYYELFLQGDEVTVAVPQLVVCD